MVARSEQKPVPRRALFISLGALAVPVASAFWLPDWTNTGIGMLIWLTALIPAFLLSYYRGLVGVAIALAGGMAVITATQLSVAMFEISEPQWTLLIAIVAVYLAVSIGIAVLAEVLRRERKLAEDMALVDRLTTLPNRRHADLTLESEFAAAERGRKLAVVIFDLDRFKRVNDEHGHASGDSTLKTFAMILKANTRKENLSARFGGEEFVSILRDTDATSASFYAKRILSEFRGWEFPWGPQTVSAGVAAYQKGMGSHEMLLSAADRALYQAKDGGRDRVAVAAAPADQAREAPERVTVPEIRVVPKAAPAPQTAHRVYIVDDDAAVRSVLRRMLARSGYDIWESGSPLDAIRHFTETPPPERPHVVLTDVMMPEMTGISMIDHFSQVDPTVKAIYMSGYVQSKISWAGTPGSVVAFLEKPIDREHLLATIKSVIEREAGSAQPVADAASSGR